MTKKLKLGGPCTTERDLRTALVEASDALLKAKDWKAVDGIVGMLRVSSCKNLSEWQRKWMCD